MSDTSSTAYSAGFSAGRRAKGFDVGPATDRYARKHGRVAAAHFSLGWIDGREGNAHGYSLEAC